jgi:histidinol-phosphate phosphatase family protein
LNALPTALFLDRDGTIIEDEHYISDPAKVRLIDGAADAIARANAALVPVIVVTNQSGIGRGYFSLEDHAQVSRRVDELLAEQGARIDATYMCPHAPDDNCKCRKPGYLLFSRAADDHPEVDLSNALYVGDRMRDIEPGLALGGQGVLVPSRSTPPGEIRDAIMRARVVPSLGTVIDWFLCTN